MIFLGGLEDIFQQVGIFTYPVQILGAAILPAVLSKCGALRGPKVEKRLTVALLALSVAILAMYSFVQGRTLHLALFYLLTLCPSLAMGISLRRGTLLWQEGKAALYIGVAYLLHNLCAELEYYAFFATGSVVFYLIYSFAFFVGLLVAVIVLRVKLRDDYAGSNPPTPHTYPPRFVPIMLVLIIVHSFFSSAINTVIYFENMDNFHTIAYELFFYILANLVILGAVVLFHRRKWLATTIACLLLLCFGQGLSLFGIGSAPLAITYNLVTMTGKMPPLVLSLILPVYYAIVTRKPGVACLGFAITSGTDFLLQLTQLTEKGIGGVLPGNSRQGLLLLVGLCLIGVVFFLYIRFEHANTDALQHTIQAGHRERKSLKETVESLDLTVREKEVTTLLLSGDSQKMIAAKLGISSPTVSFHTQNIYRKLNIQSKAELFALFLLAPSKDAS